jgi:hypothetical protein
MSCNCCAEADKAISWAFLLSFLHRKRELHEEPSICNQLKTSLAVKRDADGDNRDGRAPLLTA